MLHESPNNTHHKTRSRSTAQGHTAATRSSRGNQKPSLCNSCRGLMPSGSNTKPNLLPNQRIQTTKPCATTATAATAYGKSTWLAEQGLLSRYVGRADLHSILRPCLKPKGWLMVMVLVACSGAGTGTGTWRSTGTGTGLSTGVGTGTCNTKQTEL